MSTRELEALELRLRIAIRALRATAPDLAETLQRQLDELKAEMAKRVA